MMKKIITLCIAWTAMHFAAFAQPCIPNTSALDFDGVGSNVRIEGTTGLENPTAITIEAWIYARAFAPTQSGNSIFCKHRWDNYTYGYVLRAGGSGILSFNIAGAVGGTGVGWKEVASAPNALSLNTWYHVAATFDGNTLACYVNGNQVGTLAFSGTINMSTGLKPRIGRLADTTWGQTRLWNGMIDEVRVWNRALTQTEIQAGMSDHINPAIQNGLTGYWRLNENTGSICSDLGSAGNNGTNLGATWTTNVPFNNMSLPTPVITWVAPNLHSSYSYGNQWYNGSTLIAGATQQNYHPTSYGTYRVQVTNDTTGCNALSAPFLYNTTGIKDESSQVLTLSPNPATDLLHLAIPATYRNARFQVSDITGRVLLNGTTADEPAMNLDISSFNPGIYFLSVNTGSTKILKFTVSR